MSLILMLINGRKCHHLLAPRAKASLVAAADRRGVPGLEAPVAWRSTPEPATFQPGDSAMHLSFVNAAGFNACSAMLRGTHGRITDGVQRIAAVVRVTAFRRASCSGRAHGQLAARSATAAAAGIGRRRFQAAGAIVCNSADIGVIP